MAIKFDHTGAGDVTLDSIAAASMRVDGVEFLTENSVLGDFSDVDFTGLANNDLIFRSGGNWIDTAGRITWDGATLLIADAAINDTLSITLDGTDINFDLANTVEFNITHNAAQAIAISGTTSSQLRVEGGSGIPSLIVQPTANGQTPFIQIGNTAGLSGGTPAEFHMYAEDASATTGQHRMRLQQDLLNDGLLTPFTSGFATRRWTGYTTYEFYDGPFVTFYDSGNSNTMRFTHDGTDFLTHAAVGATNDWQISNLDGDFWIRDGAGLKLSDLADNDTVVFQCDGTDLTTTLTNVSSWNITGMTQNFSVTPSNGGNMRFNGTAFFVDANANLETGVSVGETSTLRGDSAAAHLRLYGEDTSVITYGEIRYTGAAWSVTTNPTNHVPIRFSIDTQIGGRDFVIYDSSIVGSCTFDHDGTDFNQTFAGGTTAWNITGPNSEINIPNAQINMAAGDTVGPTFRAPHGAAPTTPTNGDFWTTTAGVFCRVNGTTVDLTATGGGGDLGDLTDVTDAGSANDLLYKTGAATWGDTAGLLTWDASTLIANRKSNATTLIQVGETTTLRGDSQIGEMRLYGEDTSAISFATIQYNGTELRLSNSGSQPIYMLDDVYLRTGHTLYCMNGANTQSMNFTVATDSTIDSTSGDIIMTPASQLIVQGGATDATKLMIDAHDTVGSVAIEFRDSAAAEKGTLGFDNNADDNFFLKNKETGGEVRIQATATGGTTQPAIYIDPDTDLAIYHGPGKGGATTVSNEVMQTRSVETDGELSGVKVADANDVFRWVGFNTALPIQTNSTVSTTSDLWRDNAGHTMYSDNATAYTWTTPGSADSVVPDGYFVGIASTGSGAITIAAGSGVTLTWMDGAGSTGSRTLNQYGYGTLVKVSSTVWWIFGSGLT